jgi:hypothetical protein
MSRNVVLVLALVFLVGFAALTIGAIAEQGLTAAGVISILILVLLSVGIIGALRNPPRR